MKAGEDPGGLDTRPADNELKSSGELSFPGCVLVILSVSWESIRVLGLDLGIDPKKSTGGTTLMMESWLIVPASW